MTPSSVASSAERGPSTSPARTRPGVPSSVAPRARPRARGPGRRTSVATSGSGCSRGPRRGGAAAAVGGDLGVVAGSRSPRFVEPREVEVALVLVQRPAGARRGAGELDLEPLLASTSAASRPSQPPPQSATSTGPATARRVGDRVSTRRRPRGTARAHGRSAASSARAPVATTAPRSRARRRRRRPVVGRLVAEPDVDRRPARAARGVAAPARATVSRCAGARPASRSWPPNSSARSISVTASPARAASTAAATPAGPRADDQHAQRTLRPGASRQRALAPGARVDEAADRHAGVVVADAALVAADAGEHVAPAPAAALATSSGSAISARVMPTASAAPRPTSRSAASRSTTRVVRDHRHVDRGAAPRRAARRSRLGRRRRRRDPARARQRGRVAEHERGEVDQPGRAERAGDLGAGRVVEPLGRELVGREPHADREPGPAASPHRRRAPPRRSAAGLRAPYRRRAGSTRGEKNCAIR